MMAQQKAPFFFDVTTRPMDEDTPRCARASGVPFLRAGKGDPARIAQFNIGFKF